MYKYTNDEKWNDYNFKLYLPQIGGITLYIFGNISKLLSDDVKIAARSHDECNGSDVFGTDICTCKPYLLYGIKGAVECAQRGDIGIIAYFRKEGRALGEVTKFRVYNQRKSQEGGDRSETYFENTLNIAGIIDARIQDIMPEVYLWLGINKIDWFISMSNEKYNALKMNGLLIGKQISIPVDNIHPNSMIEINAKIKAGYNNFTKNIVDIDTLYSYDYVKKQSNIFFENLKKSKSTHFIYVHSNYHILKNYLKKYMEEKISCHGMKQHSRLNHYTLDSKDYLKRIK